MANCQNKCFISLAFKALKIRNKFKLYTAEKEYAKTGNENADVNKCVCPEYSKLHSSIDGPSNRSLKQTGVFNRFLVEDTIENFILKSVFGFLGGILLTYICFMFLVFSLNFTLKRATYICMGLGVILSLGLAFSVKIRCTVFLCIPQLFSKRGRQALLAYAFILALSGPAKNTLHNVEVMSESLACAQEQLKQAENELLKCVHKPNAAAKKSIEKLLEKMFFAVKDFKNFILQLYKNCFDILETVLQAQKWLYSITLLCQNKMGKPAHRCLDLLSDSIENCQSLSCKAPWAEICKIDPGTQGSICSTSATAFCLKSDVPECLPVLRLQKQLDVFKHRVMNILYVKIEAHQIYSQSNRSYTYHEEYQGMATEIRQKTDQFLQYFDFMSVIFGIFILVLFVKVIIYRHKFLTEDHYDNRYITSDFVDIDNTRAEFQMETLLPLEPREKMKYIKVTSIRLVPCERVRLLSSFVFLIFATFKIIIHILTDSSLYWILSSVRRDERLLYMSTLREEEPSITVRVVGYGLVAALLQNVTRAVKRQSTATRLDPTPCLPDPVPPDWNRYYQILALVIICWLLALCEPYGLRLRHTVMVTYHPDRARERAIWLYNRIISNRTSFVKLSRREIRRKYKDIPREGTFRSQFMKKASSPKCLLCKNTISSVNNRVECPTAHCVGVYCETCFACLKFCSICSDPAEYGDLSDLSEEKDSSEEETIKKDTLKKKSSTKKTREKEEPRKFILHFRKPDFILQSHISQKDRASDSYLLKPTLLLNAVKFCRNKISTFEKLRNVPDVESKDWEYSSHVVSVVEKRKWEREGGDTKQRERKDSSGRAKKTGKKQYKDPHSDKKSKNQKGHDPELQKFCLFQKVTPTVTDDEQSGVEVQTLGIEEHDHFAAVKDSVEAIRKKQKMKDSLGCNRKCSVGVALVAQPELKNVEPEPKNVERELKNVEPEPKNVEPESKNVEPEPSNSTLSNHETAQAVVYPVEVDSRCSESEFQKRITFPFIDPINIHEFTGDGGIWERVQYKRESFRDCLEEEVFGSTTRTDATTDVTMPPYVPHIPYSPRNARVCLKRSDSSETVTNSVRICIRNDPFVSSTESDCQFYTQPYYSSNSTFEGTEVEGMGKKTSLRIDSSYKSSRDATFYAMETDSSTDRVLAMKPTHWKCFGNFPKRGSRCSEVKRQTLRLAYQSEEDSGTTSRQISLQSSQKNVRSNDKRGLALTTALLSDLPSCYKMCFTETSTDGD